MASGPKKVRAVPKFGDWEGNNQNASAGFTVIFNKARDEKRATAAATGAPASTFAPPPPPKPVSALAPPRLPKNESHCTIKPPNHDGPMFNKPDPIFNNKPHHDDNQFHPPPKRRWFCCG